MNIYVSILIAFHLFAIFFSDAPKVQVASLGIMLPIYGRILGVW